MKRRGYKMIISAGLLAAPLALAQGGAQQPARGAQGRAQQEQCPCPMMEHGGGMGGAGMGCPMRGMADVQYEQTSDGAILRFTARDPAQTDEVQRMAQMMERCMGGGTQAQPGTPSPQQQP
jgi:hypothetical protein